MPDVELMEVGTAGIRLAQELLTPCDRLIIVDAMTPGRCARARSTSSEVESVEATGEVDLHLAVPSRALGGGQGARRAAPPRSSSSAASRRRWTS